MSENLFARAALEARWHETLDQSNLSDLGAAWKDIEIRYCEPHRHYHTLTHLAQCLDLLLQSQHDSPVLRLAIFYHDLVYDTHRQDNESASAELAGEQLAILGCPATQRKEICSLILATAHLDNAEAMNKPAHILCDIDLATLGSPPDDYDLYAKQIRCEYDWVSSEDFHAGRSAVLRSFLMREHLYLTEEFCTRFEQQARANMKRELKQLAAAQGRSGRRPEN